MDEYDVGGKDVGKIHMGARDTDLEITEEEDTEEEDAEVGDTQEEDAEEEDTWEGSDEPLELGGFLTPMHKKASIPTLTDTPARDLSVGQVVLFRQRPCEIIGKTASLALSGPLASRHTIALELIELFDKEALTPLVVRAKDKLELVSFARVRYSVLGFEGQDQSILILQKQHRDSSKRSVVRFRVPAGKLGDDLGSFFTQCDEEEDRPGQAITLLILEAVGRFQLVGFGIGDWESLG